MVNAKTLTDFSVDVGSTIDIDDVLDFQAFTFVTYTGTFHLDNVFSLNADLDFNNEATFSYVNNFLGTFNGNGFRIMNYSTVNIFNTITTGASLDNFIIYNFHGTNSAINTLSGTGSITKIIMCGTVQVTVAPLLIRCSGTSMTFEDNFVILSGNSRITGGSVGGICGLDSANMTRCGFIGTSDVFMYGSSLLGGLASDCTHTGLNYVNFNGNFLSTNICGGLFGKIDSVSSAGGSGNYACGNYDIISTGNSRTGRLFGQVTGDVRESYYYGDGDLSSSDTLVYQVGYNSDGGTAYMERLPSTSNGEYTSIDYVDGNGHKGDDISVWAGGSFAGPDILKDVPHYVPIENFKTVYDPIGEINLHLANHSEYPVFMKFVFDDPDVSFIVLDKSYTEITNYSAKIVSRNFALSPGTLDSGSYYVNCTLAEFDVLVAPTTSIGTSAKTITDFSTYIGDVILDDFADIQAMFTTNYPTKEFHLGNRYFITSNITYDDNSAETMLTTDLVENFKGVLDGMSNRLINVSAYRFKYPWACLTYTTIKDINFQDFDAYLVTSFMTNLPAYVTMKRCNVYGRTFTRGPVLARTNVSTSVMEDIHVLLSDSSYIGSSGSMGSICGTTYSAKRMFASMQKGCMIQSGSDECGGVIGEVQQMCALLGSNLYGNLQSSGTSSEGAGSVCGRQESLNAKTPCKGFFSTGKVDIHSTTTTAQTYGLVGSIENNFRECYYANQGEAYVYNYSANYIPPSGWGTSFSKFTGAMHHAIGSATHDIDVDITANQGGVYTLDATIWTAPWLFDDHLDYPSILAKVPFFVPLFDEEPVVDPICTVTMTAEKYSQYSCFFKIETDAFKTDFHVDVLDRKGLQVVFDNTIMVQFVFPFAVEATKNIIFRGTTLTSVDSLTYLIGGTTFTSFPITGINAKDITDFTVQADDNILVSDVTDFDAMVTSEYFPNRYLMTADIDLHDSASEIITNWCGVFDGQGFHLKNGNGYLWSTFVKGLAVIKNIVFENYQSQCPVSSLTFQSQLLDCVSCGTFEAYSCFANQGQSTFTNFTATKIRNCYGLVSGTSKLGSGLVHTNCRRTTRSFFCGSSDVVIYDSIASGCISSRVCLIEEACGANFKGAFTGDYGSSPSESHAGLYGRMAGVAGYGNYICGDYHTRIGGGIVSGTDSMTYGNNTAYEMYSANKGDSTGSTSTYTPIGSTSVRGATVFADFSGKHNNVAITTDIVGSTEGVYTRAPDIWYAPWTFDTTRPSFLKLVPHFIPMEDSVAYNDILGTLTVEVSDVSLYPVFVKLEYIDDTECEITFYSRLYREIISGFGAEITLPLASIVTITHNGATVTSVDSLTYNFGNAIGATIVTPLTGTNAESITDFSVPIDGNILLETLADVQALYQTNYTGAFWPFNTFQVVTDIDLFQPSFATTDVIRNFKGGFYGNEHKLLNHQGAFIQTTGTSISMMKGVHFVNFAGSALNAFHTFNVQDCVFISNSLPAVSAGAFFGAFQIQAMKNVTVLVSGNTRITNGLIASSRGEGLEHIFVAGTSDVEIDDNSQFGILAPEGYMRSHYGINFNGTFRCDPSSGSFSGPYLGRVNEEAPSGAGAAYVCGGMDIINEGTAASVSYTQRLTNSGNVFQRGVFMAVTGTFQTDTGTDLTTYIATGTPYATIFSDYVENLTIDQEGASGGVYDVEPELWCTPWVFNLGYPSILKDLDHYIPIENGDQFTDISGSYRVIYQSYPCFLRMSYSEETDGSDRFTFTLFDDEYEPQTAGVVVILQFPFEVQTTTSIYFDGEAADSTNNLSYTLGSPFYFDKVSPISMEVNWLALVGVESYQLTRTQGSADEVIVLTDTTRTKVFMSGLVPQTSYLLNVYSKFTGTTDYVLSYTTTAVSLANLGSNYGNLVSEVVDETTGAYDLTLVTTENLALMGDIMGDIFPDKAVMSLTVGSDTLASTLVHNGSSVSVGSSEAIVAAFDNTTTGQFISIETSSGTDAQLDFNELDNNFTFDGNTIEIGESIIVDGKRLLVLEF